MKAERDLVRVAIFTSEHKIVGDIHVIPGGRISDFLASKISGNFIPVTNAIIYKDEKQVLESKFLSLNTRSIIMLYPLMEPKQQES